MTDPTDAAWQDYLAATQRLDAVRRGQADAAAERERSLRAAQDELAGVRARLAPQYARLRELGAPEDLLAPGQAELTAAAAAVGAEPAAALTALRQARMTADAADAAVVGGSRSASSPPWLRNMLVYGPFAAVVFLVQVGLFLAVDGDVVRTLALCGLAMPALAVAMGWLVVGLVFPPGPEGKVERTPLAGAVVCLAPVVLVCVGAGALAVLR